MDNCQKAQLCNYNNQRDLLLYIHHLTFTHNKKEKSNLACAENWAQSGNNTVSSQSTWRRMLYEPFQTNWDPPAEFQNSSHWWPASSSPPFCQKRFKHISVALCHLRHDITYYLSFCGHHKHHGLNTSEFNSHSWVRTELPGRILRVWFCTQSPQTLQSSHGTPLETVQLAHNSTRGLPHYMPKFFVSNRFQTQTKKFKFKLTKSV